MASASDILDEIRRHFAAHPSGMVQVTTMTRATRYRSPDWFRVSSKGNLQVRRGRTWDTISLGGSPLVGIRLFNPAADTPEIRYQRAVGHGERLSTARKAAANPGRTTGRMAPNCPMCGALVRLRNPIPPVVRCSSCGAESRVRRP